MNVIYGLGKVKSIFNNTVLVIGVFDGLHLGHQRLIKEAIQRAHRIKGKVVVMTFDPHPVHVLRPEIFQPLIVSLKYRLMLIKQCGVKTCMVVRFTKKFASLTPKAFIQKYVLAKIKPKEIFVGEDFRFGQNREGDIASFKELTSQYGIRVNAVMPLRRGIGHGKIGSTTIRQLIMAGKLDRAARLLGRPVSLLGVVTKGSRRGKKLGYPTANVIPHIEVIPPRGVYAVNIKIGQKKYRGMANVGSRPSFQEGSKVIVEVHLFHFHRNVYGKEILVEFLKRIRDEKFFPSTKKLVSQLERDAKKVQQLFSSRLKH